MSREETDPEARLESAPADDERVEARSGPSAKRMAILAASILVAAGGVSFVFLKTGPSPERTVPEAEPPLVRVVRAEPRTHRLTVLSQGTVRPRTESTLAAQVSGRIVSVSPNLREGAFFEAGEVLARIEDADYRLALRDAEAAVEQARARLERTRAEAEVARAELESLEVEEEASPLARYEPQLAEARASLEAARGALGRARLNLERTSIEAPYAGRIRSKQVDLGQIVAPGTPVATVFGTEAAEVRLPVTREDLGYLPSEIALGDAPTSEVRVLLRGELAGRFRSWSGRLVRTGGEIDSETRMLSLFVEVEDPYRRAAMAEGVPLPMGLFVEAEVPGRSFQEVFLFPRAALSGRNTLHVVGDDDRLQIRPVEILRSTEDRLVVTAGVAAGDRVIVSRLDTVTDGMKVRVAGTASGDEKGSDVSSAAGESS